MAGEPGAADAGADRGKAGARARYPAAREARLPQVLHALSRGVECGVISSPADQRHCRIPRRDRTDFLNLCLRGGDGTGYVARALRPNDSQASLRSTEPPLTALADAAVGLDGGKEHFPPLCSQRVSLAPSLVRRGAHPTTVCLQVNFGRHGRIVHPIVTATVIDRAAS